MYSPLLDHIRKYVPISGPEEKILLSYVKPEKVKNKGFILKAGQICQANVFVVEGCLRMYLNTDQGDERIIQFGINNWWIADYMSMERQQSSSYNIQAVENSSIIILERKIQDELFDKIPKLERYFRIIHQRAYAATLTRIHYIFTFSGEQRYHQFNNSFPDFVQRVPQYMLASYLGFTPEFLSKIRAKKG